MKDKKIAVWFSCGAASAVATKLTIEKYGKENSVRVLNNPVAEEDPDNQRFLRDVAVWLGIEIESVINPNWPNASAQEVWQKRKYMAGVNGAPCTFELKKRARQIWENSNQMDFHVLGYTAEEKHRFERFKLKERKNTLAPLIEARLSKNRCFEIIRDAGLKLPAAYEKGFANANCIGCVKASKVAYWRKVQETSPEVFAQRAVQSREIGARLLKYNGKRMFLDEMTPTMRSRAIKSYSFECGLFCEEKE